MSSNYVAEAQTTVSDMIEMLKGFNPEALLFDDAGKKITGAGIMDKEEYSLGFEKATKIQLKVIKE